MDLYSRKIIAWVLALSLEARYVVEAIMQRKWREAMPKGEIGKKSMAAQGYKFCNRLFALERKLDELNDAERQEQRREKAAPIIEEYYAWIETITLPTGKLKEAVTYALNQKEYLCAFLEHGEIEISNNQVENAIRPFVIGRKGWLFSDTPDGAEATAIVYSLMETAKANNLRLEDYIQYLLTVLPECVKFSYQIITSKQRICHNTGTSGII